MALTTFLVEDNKTIRDNLISTLEEMGGARVIGTAETELAAILWLQSHDGQWDLAIVDLFLKEGSGLGVLQGCKEREPHQRVVVLSNWTKSKDHRWHSVPMRSLTNRQNLKCCSIIASAPEAILPMTSWAVAFVSTARASGHRRKPA